MSARRRSPLGRRGTGSAAQGVLLDVTRPVPAAGRAERSTRGVGVVGNDRSGGNDLQVFVFAVLPQVREGQARGDYRDPGHYKHPPGTVAREWTGDLPPAPQAPGMPQLAPPQGKPLDLKRGGGHEHH